MLRLCKRRVERKSLGELGARVCTACLPLRFCRCLRFSPRLEGQMKPMQHPGGVAASPHFRVPSPGSVVSPRPFGERTLSFRSAAFRRNLRIRVFFGNTRRLATETNADRGVGFRAPAVTIRVRAVCAAVRCAEV